MSSAPRGRTNAHMFQLVFYRRVGDAPLRLDEVDAAMAAHPGLSRHSETATDPPDEVHFIRQGPGAGSEFEFRFKSPDPDADESPGRADFPFEVTPLDLRIGYLERAEDAEAAMEA